MPKTAKLGEREGLAGGERRPDPESGGETDWHRFGEPEEWCRQGSRASLETPGAVGRKQRQSASLALRWQFSQEAEVADAQTGFVAGHERDPVICVSR